MFKNTVKYLFRKFGLKIIKVRQTNQHSDDLTTRQIGNYSILLNKNHVLPHYLKQFPSYSSNLPRLAKKIKEKFPDLILIDVGANVGDTVALIRSESYFPIVCIEGDDFYYSVLKKNIQQFNEVDAFQFFLGEKNEVVSAHKEVEQGTLKIVLDSTDVGKNKGLSFITLDHFLKLNPKYQKAKLLKIDTDGFDLMILRGGIEYLQKTRPVLFIEYDRCLLSNVNDDGLSTLFKLEEIGYETVMFYDNFGRFILSAELQNKKLIEQLHFYIDDKKSAFPYYDICLFHKDDKEFAEEVINSESAFFINLK